MTIGWADCLNRSRDRDDRWPTDREVQAELEVLAEEILDDVASTDVTFDLSSPDGWAERFRAEGFTAWSDVSTFAAGYLAAEVAAARSGWQGCGRPLDPDAVALADFLLAELR